MLLGTIIGKVTTTEFSFSVSDSKAKKFEFIQVMHPDYGYVLGQIVELEHDVKGVVALCQVIGYKDKEGILRQPRTPVKPGSEVLIAEDTFITEVIRMDTKDTAFIGRLEGKDIPINLDLSKLLTKHVAILAKTGAGKSYAAGVLVEEILERKIPLLIIDPHGEYSMIKEQNSDSNDTEKLVQWGLKPKGYRKQIQEYGDLDISADVKPLLLNEEMTPKEILSILPAKLTGSQQAALYSVMKDLKTVTLSQVISHLEQLEGNTYSMLSMVEYIKNLNLFSINYTPYTELIQPGKCSIINLKGIEPEIQEIIVFKLLKDLFEMRKAQRVAPFFCVIEEAHNFIPERGTGEKKSSTIIRTLAAEGRKFGLGLCVITQRPARIEKNVLSQCNTQIILKVTNPHDIKAITTSIEGITAGMEKEIPNLPIGTAIVTGVSEMPLAVRIRPRMSKHGGSTVDILAHDTFTEQVKQYQESEILPVIDSRYSIKEIKLMQEQEKQIQTYLIPAVLFTIAGNPTYNLLIDRIKGHIIADIAHKEIIQIDDAVRLEDHQSYEKVVFKQVHYDKKLEPKLSIEAIKKRITIIADIVEATECFVVHHYTKT